MNQRGQALPLIGIAALVLVGFAGFAVDAGYHQYQQRVQQTATDSAALAAGRELLTGSWQKAAQQDATLNGFTDNRGVSGCDSTVSRVCVFVDNPPVSPDAYAGNTQAVEVRISVNHPTFFERVFGYNKATVVTKAVAVLKPVPNHNCMYVLNSLGQFNGSSGGGQVNAPNCGLVFNAGAQFNNTTVNAASIECANSASSCQGGNPTFTGATPVPAAPSSDPCGAMTFCAHLLNSPPSTASCSAYTAKSGSVAPPGGCYSLLDLKKASTVSFCGLYVINGALNLRGNSPITVKEPTGCAGVTFYITANGSADFGSNNINLSAPASGDYSSDFTAGEQNTLIFQVPGNASALSFQAASCSGCSSYFSGMIYAPSANFNYTQATTTTSGSVLIVAGKFTGTGGVNSLFNAPGGPTAYTINVPVLGE